MKENEIKTLFSILVNEAIPEAEVNLWLPIQQYYAEHPLRLNCRHQLRKQVGLAIGILVVTVVVILSLVGTQKVIAAFRELFGYLPGAGFVSQVEPVRILDESVVVERDGVTVTVESAIVDAESTRIDLKIEGFPAYYSFFELEGVKDNDETILQLSDGTIVNQLSSSVVWGEVIRVEYRFPPLPFDVDSATLIMPILLGVPDLAENLSAEDWQVFMAFHVLRDNDLIEESYSVDYVSENNQGIVLVLKNIVQDTGRTILQVELQCDDPQWVPLNVGRMLRLEDNKGNHYPLTSQDNVGTSSFVQEFHAPTLKDIDWVTLILDKVDITANVEQQNVEFTLDLGTNVQVGQTWELDETVDADGFNLHFQSASLDKAGEDVMELALEFTASSSLKSVIISSPDDIVRGYRESISLDETTHRVILTLPEVPQHPVNILVSRINFTLADLWQVSWKPMELGVVESNLVAPTLEPTPTITYTPTQFPENETIAEIQALIQSGYEPFHQEGWIHMVTERSLIREAESIRPPAGAMVVPDYLMEDGWYYIDSTGLIQKSVVRSESRDGEIWSLTAIVGVTGIEFVTGTTIQWPGGEPYFDLSADMMNQLNNSSTADHSAEFAEEMFEGKSCLWIRIVLDFEQQVWIDLETGRILQVKILQPGGNQEITRYLSLEKIDAPPTEVTDLLNRVIVP